MRPWLDGLTPLFRRGHPIDNPASMRHSRMHAKLLHLISHSFAACSVLAGIVVALLARKM